MMANKIDRPNTTPTVRGICTFAVYFFAMMVNKIDRPNMTPMVCSICIGENAWTSLIIHNSQNSRKRQI